MKQLNRNELKNLTGGLYPPEGGTCGYAAPIVNQDGSWTGSYKWVIGYSQGDAYSTATQIATSNAGTGIHGRWCCASCPANGAVDQGPA